MGATVKYSLPELKVHSKLAMVSRKEGKKVKHYCYLSTGNFNESTARLYEDFGFFTADKRIVDEVNMVFDYLENNNYPARSFKHLLVGQFRMRKNIYDMIEQEIKNAKAGKKAEILIKLNSIQDMRMIERLYKASNAGVKIKMVIRGICGLIPQLEGFSENIEVISIVDRFLEHSRIYWFHNAGKPKIYLSSADWMTRNLFHRIECAFPIYDKRLRDEIKDFLDMQFKDNVKARIMDADQNNFYKIDEARPPFRSQIETYKYYRDREV
jgi:polyphosphate kinase